MSEIATVKWGILSTARIATRVAAAIDGAANAEATAVASRTLDRADFWAKEHGVGQSYGSYQELVDDDSLDAIYVPLPPSMHAEWTIKCAEAGKHVLCEKPLAMNVAEAEEMAAACRANNVQLMDATMWVHHLRTAEMLKAVNDGTIGHPRRVTSAFSFDIEPYLQTKPPHMARDPETGEAKIENVFAKELRFKRELGGGALLDLGWYNVRATLWAFGDLPRRVYASARYRNDVDMNVSAMMWFDDGRMASFDCGYDMSLRKWFEVVGTAGSLVCDDFLSPWDTDRPRYWLHVEAGKVSEHLAEPVIQEQKMIEKFCDIIRSGQLDDAWPKISIANQRICDALGKSARTEQVVEV